MSFVLPILRILREEDRLDMATDALVEMADLERLKKALIRYEHDRQNQFLENWNKWKDDQKKALELPKKLYELYRDRNNI